MRLLVLGAVFSFGCGLGTTVIGEGPPSEDAVPGQDDEDVRRNLSAMSSTGPLFECSFDHGAWPGATKGSRITITRSGEFLFVGSRTMRIDRVDRSGPFDAYVFYAVTSGDERLSIDGIVSENGRRPTYLTLRSPDGADTFSCASFGNVAPGIYDDPQLDALVTLTNGRR